MPTLNIQRTRAQFSGGGLGYRIPTPAELADARYQFEAKLSEIPANLWKAFYDPQHVELHTVTDTPTVYQIHNLLCAERYTSGPRMTLRNTASIQARQPVVGAFANGAPALSTPQSGSACEPMVPNVKLNPDRHTVFGTFRTAVASQCHILGYAGASYTGAGVHFLKATTTHYPTWYYNGTANALVHTESCRNKTIFWRLCFDKDVGRRLYINGVLVASDLTALGKAVATDLSFQLFGSGTGSGGAASLWGLGGVLDCDISKEYPEVAAALDAYAASIYPLGA